MANNNNSDKTSIYIFLLLIASLHNSPRVKSDPKTDASDFIKAECRATHYPSLCVQCLYNYSSSIQQSQLQLAHAALSVSLSRSQSFSDFVSKLSRMKGLKPTEYRAVKDCMANVGNSINQLNRSIKELGGMRRLVAGNDFDWHVGNVQTWVSTALTEQNTCLDGFAGPTMDGNVKLSIRKRVVDCSKVTSNALGLVNRFAARHNKP